MLPESCGRLRTGDACGADCEALGLESEGDSVGETSDISTAIRGLVRLGAEDLPERGRQPLGVVRAR